MKDSQRSKNLQPKKTIQASKKEQMKLLKEYVLLLEQKLSSLENQTVKVDDKITIPISNWNWLIEELKERIEGYWEELTEYENEQ